MLIPGAGSSVSFDPSLRSVYSTLAVIGLLMGFPNALVAAESNGRLGDFFKNQAWSPGSLRGGSDPPALPGSSCPLTLHVRYREATGDQRLARVCPGVQPR